MGIRPPDPKFHRRSIRLKGDDDSSGGEYFVTLLTHLRLHLFGTIADGKMILNDYGEIVKTEWRRSADLRKEIELDMDEFVIMPNHIHAIVHITDDTRKGVRPDALTYSETLTDLAKPGGPSNRSLGACIAGYKASVTVKINQLRNSPGLPGWHRNDYYPTRKKRSGAHGSRHITSNGREYEAITHDIAENPLNWQANPEFGG